MFEQLDKYHQAKQLMKELSSDWKNKLIYDLLLEKDIDYTTISSMYVRALQEQDKDNTNKLVEAEICISNHLFELQFTDKGRKKKNFDYNKLNEQNKKAIQRSLYLLNKGNRMNMCYLNEKFHYDENEAKKLSWYERNKNFR